MPVPPLVIVALGALGAALVVRQFARQWQRAKSDIDRARDEPVEALNRDAIPKLRRDPQTGIYRP